MGGKIGHGIDEAVGVLANVPQIRGIEVSLLHILLDTGDILAVDLRGLLVHGQEEVDVLHDLLIGQLDLVEAGKFHAQHPHVLLSQEQGVVGLVHLCRQIADVDVLWTWRGSKCFDRSRELVSWHCKSILYHLKLPDTGQQYTRLRAILFDDAGGCGDQPRLAKKIYDRTGMACLILCRPIARIHLYIENRLVCLGDSRDLGFEDLVTLLENSAI